MGHANGVWGSEGCEAAPEARLGAPASLLVLREHTTASSRTPSAARPHSHCPLSTVHFPLSLSTRHISSGLCTSAIHQQQHSRPIRGALCPVLYTLCKNAAPNASTANWTINTRTQGGGRWRSILRGRVRVDGAEPIMLSVGCNKFAGLWSRSLYYVVSCGHCDTHGKHGVGHGRGIGEASERRAVIRWRG